MPSGQIIAAISNSAIPDTSSHRHARPNAAQPRLENQPRNRHLHSSTNVLTPPL
jgi:hypothetical protein